MKKINQIYIVEDDSTTSFLIKRVLEMYGSPIDDIKIFENGYEAMNALVNNYETKRQLPDLILLDLNMPVMDGWDFLEALLGHGFEQKIPIYILTSSIDPSDIGRANEYSCVEGYFSKPLTKDQISKMLGTLQQ